MSKITNDGLTRSDTGCFIAEPYGNSRRQRVREEPCVSCHMGSGLNLVVLRRNPGVLGILKSN